MPAHPRLRTVTADIMDPHPSPGHRARNAVISAIGPRGTGPTTVIQDSVHSIIAAMDKTGTRRLLQVSGSIVADEGESPYMRYLVKPVARRTFLRHVCADMRRGEDEIRDSDLDWRRSSDRRAERQSGHGRLSPPRSTATCHTDSPSPAPTWPPACSAMLGDPATVHRHVAIASRRCHVGERKSPGTE